MDYFCLESRASALVADLEEYSNKCIVEKDKSEEQGSTDQNRLVPDGAG